MTALSPQLKRATPVLVDQGEGVYLFDEDGRRHLDFTAGIGVTLHRSLPSAGRGGGANQAGTPHPRPVHDRASLPLRELTERLGTCSRRARLPVLRQLRQRGRRGRHAAGTARHRPARHRRLPRLLPRPHVRCRVPDHVGHEVPCRDRAAALRRRGLAVPVRVPLRLGRGHRHRLRAARARLRPRHHLAAPRHRRVLRRARARRGRLRPRQLPVPRGLRERADRHGILLVVDEVQTGFGRTGRYWGHRPLRRRPPTC